VSRAAEESGEEEKRQAPAAPYERELLQVLLAEPGLVPVAAAEVAPEHVEHPGLRRLLEGLYGLQAEGQSPDLDRLRARLDDARLADFALGEQEIGRRHPDRSAWLRQVVARFRQRRVEPEKQELHNQLHAACDHTEAVELLRQLQKHTRGF
jgi:DNA primase